MKHAASLAALLCAGCAGFHSGAMPGEPAATYVHVAGARVRYLDVGPRDAPAVVLIHGFASSLEVWNAVVPALREHHRVLALDLKGFGWTDRPAGDYSPAAEAQLVLALMDARGIPRAAVVGHSWGASIALELALAAPSRVTRLVLYDAWAFDEQLPSLFKWARAGGVGETLFGLYYRERPDEKLEQGFYDKHLVTERLAEDVERAMDRPGTVAAALAAVRGMHYDQIERRYREIQQPTLLLWGREDNVTTLDEGERLASELPDARLVVYPRCGHFPMLEAAAASTGELTRFVAADLTPPAPTAEPAKTEPPAAETPATPDEATP